MLSPGTNPKQSGTAAPKRMQPTDSRWQLQGVKPSGERGCFDRNRRARHDSRIKRTHLQSPACPRLVCPETSITPRFTLYASSAYSSNSRVLDDAQCLLFQHPGGCRIFAGPGRGFIFVEFERERFLRGARAAWSSLSERCRARSTLTSSGRVDYGRALRLLERYVERCGR